MSAKLVVVLVSPETNLKAGHTHAHMHVFPTSLLFEPTPPVAPFFLFWDWMIRSPLNISNRKERFPWPRESAQAWLPVLQPAKQLPAGRQRRSAGRRLGKVGVGPTPAFVLVVF